MRNVGGESGRGCNTRHDDLEQQARAEGVELAAADLVEAEQVQADTFAGRSRELFAVGGLDEHASMG
jgi:hypothetical protein